MDQYSSSDSDDDRISKTLDFSYRILNSKSLFEDIEEFVVCGNQPELVVSLNLHHNILYEMPENLTKFSNLRKIDLSSNRIVEIPLILTCLQLQTLILKNNELNDYSFSKTLGCLENTLENFNLSGNNFTVFPEQLLNLSKLKFLSLGGNRIEEIPYEICKLSRLQILGLSGNALREVPNSLCRLKELQGLFLSDNNLESLPACIANLKELRSLQLHRNKLKTLPTEIVTLKYLSELSLRDNPLISKFVSDMVYNPPSLKEVSARVVKLYNLPYNIEDLPANLFEYLQTAHHCVNPNCKGVYFDSRVEHIKFVDFCGKYRVPLLQYLCSSNCVDYSVSCNGRTSPNRIRGNNSVAADHLMRKVLLG